MIITIMRADGLVGVDGVFRRVVLPGIDTDVSAIQFDTERATGKIEFEWSAKEDAQERDFDAEQAQEATLREQLELSDVQLVDAIKTKNKPKTRTLRDRSALLRSSLNALQPIMKATRVPRRPAVIGPADFAPYAPLIEAWRKAKPPEVATAGPTLPPAIGLLDVIDLLKAKGVISDSELAAKLKSKAR